MNSKKNYLVVITAPSGAGKTTLCQKLLVDFPELVLSISSTTRAPRGTEKEGVEYFFLNQQDFEKKIREGRFAEWAKVHGNYYGTSKEVIERAFAAGQSLLLDIDVQGAKQIEDSYPDHNFRIFIAPPDLKTLEARLRSRQTDSEEVIVRRMNHASIEMKQKDQFDAVIINDVLERAYSELKDLLRTKLNLRETVPAGSNLKGQK